MRGGKGWFAVEKKSFEISLEDTGGRLRGVIVERSREFPYRFALDHGVWRVYCSAWRFAASESSLEGW